MNTTQPRARLAVHSQKQIAARVSAGPSAVDVAAAFGVLVRTVRKRNHTGHRLLSHGLAGDRRRRNHGAGWDFMHLAVDDATRLASVLMLGDQRKGSCNGLPLRALPWFRTQGIRAERVLTEIGGADRSRRFAKALRWLAIRHIFTRPCPPKTDGMAEPFVQTLLRERACALAPRSCAARNADLLHWLDCFNQSRTHLALNDLSPLKQVDNLTRPHTGPHAA